LYKSSGQCEVSPLDSVIISVVIVTSSAHHTAPPQKRVLVLSTVRSS
jgi:hypothetical protein